MTFSNVCFSDNEFIGSGVVVVEGSSEDFFSSGVTGTIDPTLDCAYASIGFDSCVEYDSDSCSASNPSEPNVAAPSAAPVPVPVAAAAPTIEGKTSSGFSSDMGFPLFVLLLSVIVAL